MSKKKVILDPIYLASLQVGGGGEGENKKRVILDPIYLASLQVGGEGVKSKSK